MAQRMNLIMKYPWLQVLCQIKRNARLTYQYYLNKCIGVGVFFSDPYNQWHANHGRNQNFIMGMGLLEVIRKGL